MTARLISHSLTLVGADGRNWQHGGRFAQGNWRWIIPTGLSLGSGVATWWKVRH